MAENPANPEPVCGFILLHKLPGRTTFQALRPLKLKFKGNKIGHAGTLDSAAEGLVIAAVGNATRLLSHIESCDKEYLFRLNCGSETSTGDNTGEITASADVPKDIHKRIERLLPEFQGELEQVPPLYSAVKVQGKRASDRARKGEDIELKSRKILIHELEMHQPSNRAQIIAESDESSVFFFRCFCSKGTYIRSLGRDLARAAGTRAHVSGIYRTKVGNFSIENAQIIEGPEDTVQVISVREMFPEADVFLVAAKTARLVRNGVRLHSHQYEGAAAIGSQGLICTPGGITVAWGEVSPAGELIPRVQLEELS